MKNLKEKSLYFFAVILGLAVISLIISLFTPLTQAFRIVFGTVYVLFLPGFVLTYLFFPKSLNENERIDWIERIALSFALSIAVVPLIVFYLNKIGIKINLLNSFLTILTIIVISLLLIKYKENIKSIFKRKK